MKQGWKIKKIGDVVQKIFAGGDKPHMFSERQTDICCVPVYGNGVTNDGLCGYTDHYVVNERCLTVSARGTVGYCCVRNEPFVPIVRLITIIPQESIGVEFLCYALSTIDIENNGVAIPQLTVPMIKNVSIPVPPIAEQEKIVAELDCLSGIIEKKKQQLKELDNLAQSIFYEMFGDPVENDKGWERLLFEKCIEKVRYTAKIATCNYATTGTFPIISQEEDYISGYWNNAEDVFMISKPVVIFGDHTRVLKYVDFDFVLGADGVKILQPIDTINAKFFLYYLIASKIPSLGYSRHYKLLKELKVLLPPLSLQQDFASKIESIEKQKELIAQSIKETETLFNSRMDYYFN